MASPSTVDIKSIAYRRDELKKFSSLISLFVSVVYFCASYIKSDKNAKKP